MGSLTSIGFKQLPLSEMEFGLAQPIAVTRFEPAELSRKLGIQFEAAKDDLDDLVTVLLRSATGRQFALVRHLHQPQPGTTILTSEKSKNITRDLNESLAILQINARDLSWVHSSVAPSSVAAY